MPRVIVIGAGIIGLSVAWQLARRGADVTILERNQPAREASWAAAGMLSPFGEIHNAGPLLDLGAESLRLFPKFLAEIAEDGGDPPQIAGPGMIRLAMSEEKAAERKVSIDLAKNYGFPAEWLTSEEVRKLEPAVSSSCQGGVLSASEVHIDPRGLCAGLQKAAMNRGVRILPFSEVCEWETRQNSVVGVRIGGETFNADHYVIAAGAYSAKFGNSLGINTPVTPRKGQIIAVQLPHSAVPFEHTLFTTSTYLVPRGDRILVGATQEDAGFDRAITEAATQQLFTEAAKIAPCLASASVVDAWTGLRPATPDGMPIVGHVPGHPNIYAATGHFRNGILLAPATAYAVADEIIGSHSSIDLTAFRPSRFAA